MILCPSCQYHEISGALFCSECGAQLIYAEPLSTQSIFRSHSDNLPNQSEPVEETAPSESTNPSFETLVTLHMVENGDILPLAGRMEYTLGRVAEGQPILPDVDLSPYDAYTQGVSRLHASLKVTNQRVFIIDLGSSNGTRVNGQKIAPNVDYPINHGDLVSLGKFKIQVLVRR